MGQDDWTNDLCPGMSYWGRPWDLPLGCDLSIAQAGVARSASGSYFLSLASILHFQGSRQDPPIPGVPAEAVRPATLPRPPTATSGTGSIEFGKMKLLRQGEERASQHLGRTLKADGSTTHLFWCKHRVGGGVEPLPWKGSL